MAVTPWKERWGDGIQIPNLDPIFAFGQMPPLDAYVRCCGGLNSEGRQGTLLFGPFLAGAARTFGPSQLAAL